MGSEEEEEEEEDQEQEDWLKKHANGLNFVIVIGGNCDGATMALGTPPLMCHTRHISVWCAKSLHEEEEEEGRDMMMMMMMMMMMTRSWSGYGTDLGALGLSGPPSASASNNVDHFAHLLLQRQANRQCPSAVPIRICCHFVSRFNI